jgi:hypothetical protein
VPSLVLGFLLDPHVPCCDTNIPNGHQYPREPNVDPLAAFVGSLASEQRRRLADLRAG